MNSPASTSSPKRLVTSDLYFWSLLLVILIKYYYQQFTRIPKLYQSILLSVLYPTLAYINTTLTYITTLAYINTNLAYINTTLPYIDTTLILHLPLIDSIMNPYWPHIDPIMNPALTPQPQEQVQGSTIPGSRRPLWNHGTFDPISTARVSVDVLKSQSICFEKKTFFFT